MSPTAKTCNFAAGPDTGPVRDVSMTEVLNSLAAIRGHLLEHGNADIVGYIAAMLTIATYSMRTMIPLRVVGICSNCLFIAYGYFAPAYPQLLLHAILLPLN